MQNALQGQRVLITQCTEFMGPALCEVLAEQGASVVAARCWWWAARPACAA